MLVMETYKLHLFSSAFDIFFSIDFTQSSDINRNDRVVLEVAVYAYSVFLYQYSQILLNAITDSVSSAQRKDHLPLQCPLKSPGHSDPDFPGTEGVGFPRS